MHYLTLLLRMAVDFSITGRYLFNMCLSIFSRKKTIQQIFYGASIENCALVLLIFEFLETIIIKVKTAKNFKSCFFLNFDLFCVN